MALDERGAQLTPNVFHKYLPISLNFVKCLGNLFSEFAPSKPKKISFQRTLMDISQDIISEDLLEAV